MDVDVDVAVELAGESETMRAGADVGERSLCGLLHDVAELAGKGELAFAVEDGDFGGENGAAHFCPRQASDQADLAGVAHHHVPELRGSEQIVDLFVVGDGRVFDAFLDDFAGDLASDVADLAFETANAGFAGVSADDFEKSGVFETEVVEREAVRLELLLDQVLLCDLEFFEFGVAAEPDDLHAVLERAGDGVQDVRGGDEQDLREVVLDVEIVILEHVVLFRIQDFE